ncbi:uncharacterized protein LOC110724020 [Chenopodium quinoa]|uniref:uncharacterized protein LOC110724020 n=1 Tax=Chenopodium quinoa TaxID=63459 RepID=UPI000B76EFF1|nr:uncharacterized protein LOC110724020 [Chenopodium quinoa]
MGDVDSSEYVEMEAHFKPPYLEFTFSKGYINKPRINIPLPFARAHFQGLRDETPIELYVSRWWKATMRIKFDQHKNIVTCNVKKGVSEMLAGEGIELGEKAVVELECVEPPILSITFT